MSTEIISASLGAAGVILGSVITYYGLRAQLREARRKDAEALLKEKEIARRELGSAELTYLVKIQEMLVEAGQRLMTVEAAHTQKQIALEREKYIAQEELKRHQQDCTQKIKEMQRFTEEQHEEILKIERSLAERDRQVSLLQGKVEALEQTLAEHGI